MSDDDIRRYAEAFIKGHTGPSDEPVKPSHTSPLRARIITYKERGEVVVKYRNEEFHASTEERLVDLIRLREGYRFSMRYAKFDKDFRYYQTMHRIVVTLIDHLYPEFKD